MILIPLALQRACPLSVRFHIIIIISLRISSSSYLSHVHGRISASLSSPKVQTIEWERKKTERSYIDTAAASAIDK
jgi:hypothetical protein